MHKLLLLVGPTATGKTSLALQLARIFKAEILSADSRQIYRGMNIGTGKDIPKSFEFRISDFGFDKRKIPYYGNGTKIWGYDLVDPDEEFSVAHFARIASRILDDIWKRGRLAIIDGGTGLYVKSITEPMPEATIPPNRVLRQRLAVFSVQHLQRLLQGAFPARYRKMNSSDRLNSRRLIRAIEVANYKKRNQWHEHQDTRPALPKTHKLWIGLNAPMHILYRRIDERVRLRLRQGAEEEVRELVSHGYHFGLSAMSASGYRQWQPYLEGRGSRDEVLKHWEHDEHAYARRQMTWFRKNLDIRWFDISKPGFAKQVVREVTRWYSKP